MMWKFPQLFLISLCDVCTAFCSFHSFSSLMTCDFFRNIFINNPFVYRVEVYEMLVSFFCKSHRSSLILSFCEFHAVMIEILRKSFSANLGLLVPGPVT